MTDISLLTLPIETLHHIFSYCDIQTILFSIRPVCKHLYSIVNGYDRFTLTLCPEIKSNFKLICRLIQPENIFTIELLKDLYYCNRMVLFHSGCDIRQCTKLRSLKIANVTDEDVIKLLSLLNINVLTSLSISSYEQCASKILEHIPSAIKKFQIQKLFLNNFDYAIKQTVWSVDCMLTHLELGLCNYEEYIMILQRLPKLRTLLMKQCIMTDNDTTTTTAALNSNIKFSSLLKSLTITEFKLSVRQLKLLISFVPALYNLRLTDSSSQRFDEMFDGLFWEEFITINLSSLQTFEIYFRTTIDWIKNFRELMTPFQTAFWTTKKRWIIACSFDVISNYEILLYTIPVAMTIDDARDHVRCEISSRDGIWRLTKRNLNQVFDATPDEAFKELNCYYGSITNEHMQCICDGLRNNTTITNLFISSKNVGYQGLEYLANVLQHNTMISEVRLRSNEIDEQGAEYLACVLQMNKTITLLELGWNKLGLKQAYHLGNGLAYNTTLTILILHNNYLRNEAMEYIGNALKTNTTLLLLNLRYNGMTEIGAKYLADGLKENKKLAILELERNGIHTEGARYLADALQHNTTLARLALEANYIHDVGVQYITNALQKNTTLKVLSLEENGIKNDGAKALADLLRNNSTLKKLYLYQNRITLDGVKCLADVLKTNTTLTTFGMGWNLTELGQHMADVIRYNKTLVELDIHYNTIKDEGAIYIADALRHNTTLALLDVSTAYIKQKGFKHLADALAVNKGLTAIDFCFSAMTVDDAKYIAKSIQNNKTLNEVRLFDKQSWNENSWELGKLHQEDNRLRYERNEGYRRLVSPQYSKLDLDLISCSSITG